MKPQSALWTSVFAGLALSLALPGCGGSASSTDGCGNNCPPPAPAEFLYATSNADNSLAVFKVNMSTGALGTPTTQNAPTSTVGILATHSAKFLYVSDLFGDSIDAFSIDAASGAISPVPGSPFSLGPFPPHYLAGGLATDPSGRFLFVTEITNWGVATFTINGQTGSLTQTATSPVASDGRAPIALAVHPSGKFLYVANMFDANISGFAIDVGGNLAELSTSPFSVMGGPNPGNIVTHPNGKFLYMILRGDNSSLSYVHGSVIGDDGSLTDIPGSPFLTGRIPYGIRLDPAAHTLYTANFGDGTISAFSVDPNSGALSSVAGSPFPAGANPYDIVIDPSGKFLYSSDDNQNVILSFTIGVGGAITPFGQPIPTVPQTAWLAIAHVP